MSNPTSHNIPDVTKPDFVRYAYIYKGYFYQENVTTNFVFQAFPGAEANASNANLKLTFDGETYELKKAEVI